MRCRHCGYSSFEELNTCKKCGEPMVTDTTPSPLSDVQQPLPLFDNISSESPENSVVPLAQREFPSFIDDQQRVSRLLPCEEALLWQRLVAAVIDIVILLTVMVSFGIVALWQLPVDSDLIFHASQWQISWLAGCYLLGFVIVSSYFIGFYTYAGQTPGQQFLGVQVRTVDGGMPGIDNALLRCAGGILSLLCLGAGYVAIMFNDHRRGWNDKIASTMVCMTPRQLELSNKVAVDESVEVKNGVR